MRGPLACPVFQAATKSAKLSASERTSIVTVFMMPPGYVIKRIGDQLVDIGEDIRHFRFSPVPMIALA